MGHPYGRKFSWLKKLHTGKLYAAFFLCIVFFCVIFTDLALKQKGQSYLDLLEKSKMEFWNNGMRTLSEELLPVYDFLGYGSSDAGLFAELSETVVPAQQYLARECFARHPGLESRLQKKQNWKRGKTDGKTKAENNVLDYDQMVYEENRQNAREASSNAAAGNLYMEAGENPEQYIAAESYYEDTIAQIQTENQLAQRLTDNGKMIEALKKTESVSYLLSNFYIVDGSTNADKKKFKVERLLNRDMTMKKTETEDSPQIMIYHTHASEKFADSRKGNYDDTVVGVGSVLADILENIYGYQVYHDTTRYDMIDGSLDRNKAYNQAADGIEKALKKYPSIEVIIDLHRDSGNKRVTTINGKKTAQIMLFNGISRNRSGNIGYLYNPNLVGNLAFSLQMKLAAMELYPDFAKPIYIKGYRYNLHYREKSLLIELGTDQNTLEEATNAMEPLAAVLDRVLSGNQG